MALSDCVSCWNTPCICGSYYRNYTKDKTVQFILTVLSKQPAAQQRKVVSEVKQAIDDKFIDKSKRFKSSNQLK